MSEGEALLQPRVENGGHVQSDASLGLPAMATTPQESVTSLIDAVASATATFTNSDGVTTTSSASSVDSAARDFEMRGVKLALLKAVAAQAKLLGGIWTVGRVSNVLLGAHEILQDNHRWGAVDPIATLTYTDRIALIDVLRIHHKDASCRHPLLGVCYDEVVGDQADVFVSFAYNCDFFELVGSIEAFVAANPDHAEKYFWFDMLVNNQWTASNKSFEWWASTFKEAVGRIGHTLLIGVPWSDPEPLKRAWCLFEIYGSLASNSRFDVAMGAEQQERFMQAMIADAAVYYKMLGDIDVRKSDCYVAQDKANIFRVVEESVGFAALNSMVISKMRAWTLSAVDASIAQSGADTDTPRTDVWDKLAAKGTLLQAMGEYDASLAVLLGCMQEFADVDATDGKRWGGMHHLLGNVHFYQGNYPLAQEHYEKCLAIRLQARGLNLADERTLYYGMANVYQAQGSYPLALEYYEKSLAIQLQTLGPNHPDVGNSHIGMANVYYSQGNYPLALEHHEKSLAIKLLALGPNHPDVGNSHNNMANVYKVQGHYQLALEHHEKSLVIKLHALGPNHPSVGNSYNNIAMVYAAQGNHLLALEHYEKSLVIRLHALGPNHPDVGSSYNNMAGVYYSQGNYPLALEHFDKSLAIRLQALGPNHPDVGNSHSNMAHVYESLGNYPLALEHYEKSLAIRLQVLGPNHPDLRTLYHGIAGVYYSQGNYPLALEHFEKSLAIMLQALGPNHPDVGDSHYNIAIVFKAQGNYPLALEHYEKCLAIRLQALGPNHSVTLSTLRSIRDCRALL